MRISQRHVLKEAVNFGSTLVGWRDAVYVMQNVTGCTNEEILIGGDTLLRKEKLAEFKQKIKRLASGEPLQYVLGKWDFCGIEFIVDKRALIPRPETELLVEAVVDHVKGKQRLDILDVCTGSGCIGLSIAKLTEFRHNVVLADVSDQSLSLARENCLKVMPASTYKSLQEVRLSLRGARQSLPRAKHGGSNPGMHSTTRDIDCIASLAMTQGISITKSNLLDEVSGEFDIIVSNPPYILSHEMETLPENVKNYEPHLALDGGEDGLDIYKRLIPQSYDKLKPGGALFLEIGSNKAKELMQKHGFADTKIQKDYAGIDRILQGVKSNV